MPPVSAPLRRGMSGIGVVAVAAALLVTAGAAWWLRVRNGRIRPGGAASDEASGARAVLESLGARPGDADLTVVQFSTAFCGPCRTTRSRLQHMKATRPGLAYVHVDAESHLDAVRALDVRRTPTLFYLDRDGALIGRSSGAPAPAELTALVDAHTGSNSGSQA